METTKRPRIIYLLLAAMFIVTAAVAMPTTNAKYATQKSYSINITSIIKNKTKTLVRDAVKTNSAAAKKITFNQENASTTSSVSDYSVNAANSNTATTYLFKTDTTYTIDGTTATAEKTIEKYGVFNNGKADHWKGEKLEALLLEKFGARNLTPNCPYSQWLIWSRFCDESSLTYTATSGDGITVSNGDGTIRVNGDLAAGWYYTKVPYYNTSLGAHNTRYLISLFYLPARTATTENYNFGEDGVPENPNIAMFAGTTITMYIGDNPDFHLVDSNTELESISFKQAYYKVEEVDAP